MPAVYEHRHTVRHEEIDPLDHANNVAYIQWMQDAALAHTEAQGWSAADYATLGHGWVVRRHSIEYLKPAFEADEIVIRTWVTNMKKITSQRQYRILRGDTLLAEASTEWVFVSYKTGQPKRIPDEVQNAFELHEE